MTSCLFRFAFVLKFKQVGRFRFDFEEPLTRSANVGVFYNMFKKHVLLSTAPAQTHLSQTFDLNENALFAVWRAIVFIVTLYHLESLF